MGSGGLPAAAPSCSLRAPAAIIALLTDFVTLADLVSLGTLAVFLLVALALVYRRCDGHMQPFTDRAQRTGRPGHVL